MPGLLPNIGMVVDDNDSASVLNPFFTSVNQPAYLMGQMAMDLLKRRMKQKTVAPAKIVLECDLHLRNSVSTGPNKVQTIED